MTIPYLDEEKCLQRNRVAARMGINAVPMRFLSTPARNQDAGRIAYARGTLPNEEGALERINASRPEGSTPLTLSDVYLHYAEAANTNFIGDRYMFLGTSTLRNIAQDAERGFAFMNSHRTGGLSHPSELPFGWTYAGRYEQYKAEDGTTSSRTLIGFYMLRGVQPNGQNGPSTDDLHRMIDGGTLSDVSMGISEGQVMCDVCGLDTDNTECPHVPGTYREMDDAQQAAQLARGVTGGRASCTLEDGRGSELSGVYDGAIPGAGFRKALRFERKHLLSGDEQTDVHKVYAALFGGDNEPDQLGGINELVDQVGAQIAQAVANRLSSPPSALQTTEAQGSATAPPPNMATVETIETVATKATKEKPKMTDETTQGVDPVEFANIKAEQDRKLAEQAKQIEKLQAQLRRNEASAFVDSEEKAHRLWPSVRREDLGKLFEQCMLDDQSDEKATALGTFGDGKVQATRTQALKAVFASLPSFDPLLTPQVKETADEETGSTTTHAIFNQPPSTDGKPENPEEVSAARRAELRAFSQMGKVVSATPHTNGK